MSATIIELAQTIGEATPDARVTIARLIRENDVLHRDNARLMRELGKARLLADLRRDHAEIAGIPIPTDPTLPAFLRRQGD